MPRKTLDRSRLFISARQLRFLLLLGFFLIAGFSLLAHSSASNTKLGKSSAGVHQDLPRLPQQGDKQGCPHCGPQGDQSIYLPLIDLPEAQGSELVFNSRSPHAMDVTPTFYEADGTIVAGEPVHVESAEIRYVNVKKLIPPNYRGARNWGGMSLSYYGSNREMWAQLRFLGVHGGGSVDEFFTVTSESRSDLIEATWWLPGTSTSIVALGNVTDVATSAVLQFGSDQPQKITLAPHATETVRHEGSQRAGTESITINVTGAPGSIIPSGVITSENGSFNSVIRFYNPKLAKQPKLFANGFRVKNVTPHMVLRNTTSERIAAQPKFITLAGIAEGDPVVLPEIILGPNETTEVDLTPLSEAARNRTDLNVVSIEVANSGAPGSLIGSLYGINSKTGVTYDIPLRDSGPVRTMTGSYPWKTSKDYTTIVYITNISDREAEFVAQINHGTERFVIDPRKLKPGETAVFDLARIRDEQMPDNLGRRLPKQASLGQFKWAVRGLTDGKLLLIGRAEMVSLSDHITTSYSCNDPCPPVYVMTIDGFPNLANINQTTDPFVAWETAQTGTGYNMGPYTGYVSCSVDSPIATFDTANGHSTTMTGTDAGEANMLAFSRMEESYGWDGRDCYDNNNQYLVGEGGVVEVRPFISSIAPNRGPVGGTVSVFIFGNGFKSSSTVAISGSGVTASSVSFGSSTQLSAIFQIATDAIEGNHGVTVTTNNVTTNSVNFFVAIPTKLRRDSISNLIDQPGGCGVVRNLSYTVLDQAGQSMDIEATLTETFSNFSGPEGLRPPNETSAQMSGGTINDTVGYAITDCPPPFTASFNQGFAVIIGNRTFHLSSSNAISTGRTSSGTKFVDITFSQ